MFDHSMLSDPWPRLDRLLLPVTVMRGLMNDGLPSSTSRRLVGRLPDVTDVPVSECDHFIPMQRPGLVADVVVGAREE